MRHTTRTFWSMALLIVMALVLIACGADGGAESTDGDVDAPVTTAEGQSAPDDTPASTEGNDDSEGEASGDEEALAAAREVTWRYGIGSVGEQTDDGSLQAFELDQLSQALGAEYMMEDGWDIDVSFIESGEDLAGVLIAGELDLVSSSITPMISAAQADVPVRPFYSSAGPVYVMAARTDMEGPEDFDDRRVAIHGAISTGALLTRSYLAEADVEPQYLIIEGSQNRLLALIADEIDASTLALGEDEVLLEERPDDFHIIYNYAQESDLLLEAISYLEPLTDEKRAFLVELYQKNQEAKEWIQSADTEEVRAVLDEMGVLEADHFEAFIENGVWDPARTLTAPAIEETVATMDDVGLIECPCPEGAEIVDESIREAAGY